jgi:GTP-binding protein
VTIHSVRFVLGAARWEHLVGDGLPEVAFLGRSNVGKSSLINLLVGRKQIARTSNTPGKTREFNFYLINESFYLVDLPGLGYARVGKSERSRWLGFIERYLQERETLRGLFHLIDSRHPPTAQDEAVMDAVRGIGMPYFAVLTKSDKISSNARARSVAQTHAALAQHGIEAPVLSSSAEKKWGQEEILQWIFRLTS